MRKYAIVAVCLVVSLVLATTVFREPIVSAAQGVAATIIGPLDGSGYVAVHEQGTANVAVTNFPATQRVSVANFPTQQAAETVQIASGYLNGSNPWVEFDATPYAKVRITMKAMDTGQVCVGGATIHVGHAQSTLQITSFTVSPGLEASQLIEVPGTNIRVSMGTPLCEVAYLIFGRTN